MTKAGAAGDAEAKFATSRAPISRDEFRAMTKSENGKEGRGRKVGEGETAFALAESLV